MILIEREAGLTEYWSQAPFQKDVFEKTLLFEAGDAERTFYAEEGYDDEECKQRTRTGYRRFE